MSHVQDSLALDLAHLKGEVPALIDTMAKRALKEVEDVANRPTKTGSDGVESNETVLSGETGRTDDASRGNG